jgi:hypothetical protein
VIACPRDRRRSSGEKDRREAAERLAAERVVLLERLDRHAGPTEVLVDEVDPEDARKLLAR